MIKTSSLLGKLAKRFPKKYAKEYQDHVGVMIGKLPPMISKVYLALDLEPDLVSEIALFKPDIIITHHPFIYKSRSFVRKTDPSKEAFATDLERLGYVVYSMHTNFDRGVGGMNDALAEKMELKDIRPLSADAMARGGRLPHPMTVEAAANYAKTKLGASYGLLLPYGKPIVETLAIVGGGGSGSYKIAQNEGYDIYLSGDAPHHVRRAIAGANYNYLDLPHEIESIFMERMEHLLLNIDPTLTIKKAPRQPDAQVI